MEKLLMTTSKPVHAPAAAAGTITLGGDLTVNRMGFGSMRLTGKGISEALYPYPGLVIATKGGLKRPGPPGDADRLGAEPLQRDQPEVGP